MQEFQLQIKKFVDFTIKITDYTKSESISSVIDFNHYKFESTPNIDKRVSSDVNFNTFVISGTNTVERRANSETIFDFDTITIPKSEKKAITQDVYYDLAMFDTQPKCNKYIDSTCYVMFGFETEPTVARLRKLYEFESLTLNDIKDLTGNQMAYKSS